MTKTRNRLISVGTGLLLFIAAVLFIIPQKTAGAETWIESAAEFAAGDGTQGAPYQISSAGELANLAKMVSGGETYESTYFELTADIDLGGKEWTPIGTKDSQFAGKFSGNGKTIRNLTVGGGDNSGLFAYSSGEIKDVYLEKIDITTTMNAGGVCAFNSGTIEGCGVLSGTIICSNPNGGQLGGICRENSGTISRCFSNASVKGATSAGIVYINRGNSVVQDCYNTGTLEGSSSASGINTNNYGKIKTCLNLGAVIAEDKISEEGSVIRGYGICVMNVPGASLENCYSDSDVCPKELFGGFRNNTTVYYKTTAELCGGSLPDGFDGSVWNVGGVGGIVDKDAADRFAAKSYTYPSLNGVGSAAAREVEVYNFSTDSTPDWQEFKYIETVEDFRKIDDDLSGNYVLAKNIDFGGNKFRPIAYKSGSSFTGKFSGNSHTISNISVNYDDDLVGLFGTNKGLIMNLAVSGEVTGEEYIGGICAKNEGTIYSCSFDGEVKQSATTQSKGKVGGICGANYATISNCFNSADVSGKDYIGGICGEMFGDDPVVVYCVSVGKVSGFTGSAIVGGICGYGIGVSYGGSSELSHCRFDMDVSGSINLINGGNTITNRGDNYSYKTEILCGDNIDSFDPDIWNAGKGVAVTPDAKDGKFGTKTCYYMSLKCFGEPEPITGDVYNFAYAGGRDDWQSYILISSEDVFRTYWQWDVKWSENFVLGDDITLACSLAPSDLIPTSLSTGTFSGMFSGNGHTVTLTDDSTCGLFGTNKGTIINLAVKGNIDSSVGSSTDNYSGGICAVNDGTIYGCSFEGKIYGGANNTGAVCGLNNKTISNCFVLANVEATNGLVGGIAALGKEGSELKSCYFVGTAATERGVGLISLSPSENCYYNKEVCQFAEEESGTALTTLEMTSYGALAKMNFTDDIWEKLPNDTANGVAYYPSFKGSTYVPSVKYTAKLELNRAGDEAPVYGDDIAFTTKAAIIFKNDYYGDDVSVEDTTGTFNAEVGGKTIIVVDNKFEDTADAAGDVTYRLVYKGSEYFPDDYSEDFIVTVGKKALTVADFNVALPADMVFSNTEKAVTVTAKPGITGAGEITVKYYGESGKEAEPFSAGTYTFKIDAAEGSNYKAVSGLTADSWKFTIEKARAETLPDTGVSYRWSTDKDITVSVAGLPENMGQVTVFRTKKDGTISAGIIPGSCYSDGKFTFHLGPNTVDDIGKTGSFTITLAADNYESVTFTVKITLTAKDNQNAPDPTAFDVVFTNDGSELTATIKTGLKGVEYSFDGTTWSGVNTTTVAHLKDVTAYLRYKETDELNASEAVFKTVNSGHGELVHHAAVQATCQNTGNVEYWECQTCARYYLDEECKTETTLERTVLAITDHTKMPAVRENEVHATCVADGSCDEVVYCAVCGTEITRTHTIIPAEGHRWSAEFEADESGHWHKCVVCSADSSVEKHVSGGAATMETPETCTVCGYIIAPELCHIHADHLTEVPEKAATCTEDGNTAYFLCSCGKLFSDSAAVTEVTLADVTISATGHRWSAEFEADKSGHWHKCECCEAVTETESHVSSGEATVRKAEYCTVCGYVITPRKSGSSGGNAGGGSHSRDNTTERNPAINGVQKTWSDIAADIGRHNGGSLIISMNGETTVPAEVIKAIADRKVKVEFVYDSTKSWIVDGVKITTVSAADLSLLPGSVDTSSLRGVSGGKYRISADIPAEIRFTFLKRYAGEFANVYKLVDGKLVFQTCIKLAEDGTAVVPGMSAPGEYAVMVCRFSDRQGDFDNNGILDIYDAVALLRYSVGLESGENLQQIDLNGDGMVNCADASMVLRWVVGLSA